jgi:uncharacterized protein (DUF1800 family)
MQQLTVKHLNHLLLRAGFGATPAQVSAMLQTPVKDMVSQQLAKAKTAKPIEIANREELLADLDPAKLKSLDKDQKKEAFKEELQRSQKLNIEWMKRLLYSEDFLNEKMTLFWHDHFACKDKLAYLAQSLNNTIRKNALGSFRDLLLGVAMEPAMLRYLNNQQNKKESPNENFARELMELFTLGRGNYTEADVKEAARAFTGWNFNRSELTFFFNPKQHDFESKTFLGVKDNLDGTNIIDIILKQKQCARFITAKIYQYFVNPVVDRAVLDELADAFYNSKYDIGALMEKIFTADWFYGEKNIGVKIKSPVELLGTLTRQLGVTYNNENALLVGERLMGQILFRPPNVAGWPEDKDWIDSSSLIFRMNLGKKIIDVSAIEQSPKGDDDDNPNMTLAQGDGQKAFASTIDWNAIANSFKQTDEDKLFDEMAGVLLQAGNLSYAQVKYKFSGTTKAEKVKAIATYIVSTPEYQLC